MQDFLIVIAFFVTAGLPMIAAAHSELSEPTYKAVTVVILLLFAIAAVISLGG